MREFETQRLKLRILREDDAEAIFYGWAADPQVTKYLTWHPHTKLEETKYIVGVWLEEYKKDNTYRWCIERKEDGELIGMIDVVGYYHGDPVIGYCMAVRYWNHGYMTEACKAVIQELFASGFDSIRIEAIDENIGSNKVIKFRFTEQKIKPISQMKPDEIAAINYYKLDKSTANDSKQMKG